MVTNTGAIDSVALERLVSESKASGGSEIANTQPFIERWCRAMGLDPPHLSTSRNHQNEYVFERRITFKHPDGSESPGRIDLYKRSCFVLESKQSSIAATRPSLGQMDLLPEDAGQTKLGTARRGTGGWDRAMLAARNQAESYARALPVEHGYPPFLLVLDVGHVLEIYADFSGQGKNYAHFPDRQTYRLTMDDLLLPDIQERLCAIWTDPLSLDPAKRSAEVTRDIAGRLSVIAKRLERKHDPKEVAEFLMRCLFTMFAEDVGLLPNSGFAALLKALSNQPETFQIALESLWKTMDEGGYEPRLMTTLKRFNGSLFKTQRALPLAAEDIHELYVAAAQDWSDVEPAIFGTLLERALDPRERSKLGAHYTPRAYVERLVIPTVIEPLRADWDEVQAHVADLKRDGKDAEALQAVRDFHHVLCSTRVLDPACGSGNFLYVSLELMKRLEGEVLVALGELGEDQGRLAMEGETVGPRQFYGLEINPRAVPIADLVLWIGFLKWQLRTVGLDHVSEPVLHAYGTIRQQDAILAYDRVELLRDERGAPVTRWDGVSVKAHPVTRELVPNPDKRVEVYRYVNPRPAEWPEAEFIVGNPPFIGNKRMISRLGETYVAALRSSYPNIEASVDLVMYWWSRASEAVLDGRSRRFGLVTTNKITQSFNRRVVYGFLMGQARGSIIFAIPDHPWSDEEASAAVRVAVTVGQADRADGRLQLVSEVGDAAIVVSDRTGTIGPSLSLLNLSVSKLKASALLSHQGVIPIGKGFRLTQGEAEALGYPHGAESQAIRPYKIGRDLLQRDQKLLIIDLFGREWSEVTSLYPKVAQTVLDRVKPFRDANRRERRRDRFWLFADSCEEMREAMSGLPRYIATCRTAKHRVFTFLGSDVLPDAKIVAVTTQSAAHLSVLSSRLHVLFATMLGGWQGVGHDPVYQHSDTFNAYPFPIFSGLSDALRTRLDASGTRLDEFRKERLAAHDFLTVTSLYNVLERVRELENGAPADPLDEREQSIHEAGLVSVLKEIHDEIDHAVFEAYGWADLIPALVGKPGATTPSPYKSPEQERAEEDLLSRMVSLNQERVAEEAQGVVRWLRSEYQIPRVGRKVAAQGEQLDVGVVTPTADRPKWPVDAFEQIKVVREVLARAPAPMPIEGIVRAFDGRTSEKRKARVRQVLDTLVATGAVRSASPGASYFVPR